jgi:aspartate kinase
LSKVFKFGGASVKNPKAIYNLKEIVSSYKENLVIVISAIDKTTNKLELVWKNYLENETLKSIEIAEEIIKFHEAIIKDLKLNNNTDFLKLFNDLTIELVEYIGAKTKQENNISYSKIVSFGELFSTIIISSYLNKEGVENQWIDAREFIKTSNNATDSRVNWEKTKRKINSNLSKNKSYLTQGFIGSNLNGETTTLGREGSDFSAAIFAWSMDVEEVIIWKDVDGLLNADPKWFNKTQILKKISFKEAIELSYLGASVIHPNTVKPLENKNIPLTIRSFIKKEHNGSSISKVGKDDKIIPSIIYKPNQILLSISSKDYSFIFEEHISDIFSIFSKTGLKVHLMQNSALSFSVCGIISPLELPVLISEIQKKYTLKYNEKVNLLTIRHFKKLDIPELFQNQEILIQQRSRSTLRYVLKKREYKNKNP